MICHSCSFFVLAATVGPTLSPCERLNWLADGDRREYFALPESGKFMKRILSLGVIVLMICVGTTASAGGWHGGGGYHGGGWHGGGWCGGGGYHGGGWYGGCGWYGWPSFSFGIGFGASYPAYYPYYSYPAYPYYYSYPAYTYAQPTYAYSVARSSSPTTVAVATTSTARPATTVPIYAGSKPTARPAGQPAYTVAQAKTSVGAPPASGSTRGTWVLDPEPYTYPSTPVQNGSPANPRAVAANPAAQPGAYALSR